MSIQHKEIPYNDFIKMLDKGETVFIYNDYENIAYRCFFDSDKGKCRYIARKNGKEFEVYSEKSNVLTDTLNQPLVISEKDYLNL